MVISDYDPAWPDTFEQLARPLRQVSAPLGGHVEHVGSTSVPGLAAKPVIDIDVVLPSADAMADAIVAVCSLGYVHQGNKGITGREAFMWPPGTAIHHLYVVVAGSKPHRDHVDLRDFLREDSDAAERYARLKRELASRFADDRLAYTEAKAEFIEEALARARRPTIGNVSRESSVAAVERFRRVCADHPLVVAAFLGGSYAAGTARPNSDIDLYVVTRPGDYAAFVEGRHEFLCSWGEPVETDDVWDFEGLGFDMTTFTMADGVYGEVAYGTTANFLTLHGGPYEILVDKTGLLEGVTFPLL